LKPLHFRAPKGGAPVVRVVSLLAALLLFGATGVQATPTQDAEGLIEKNDLAGALRVLDDGLKSSPQDAEARFTRGLVLVKLNRIPEAITAFTDLTRDFPHLPEPYNNLAVIYAQQGDYDKSRQALETALSTNPSYETAHENLGDVYAALAGEAYGRALTLDQNNAGLKYKLSLINQLAGSSNIAQPAVAVASRPEPPQTAPTAVAAAPPAEPVPPPAVDPAAAPVLAAVEVWARAWSARDVEGYLAAYAPDFTPEGGQSLDDWKQLRRDRIAKPASIAVGVLKPQVSLTDSAHARVTFVQEYHSDTLNDRIHKVLELADTGGGVWKITREYSGR